MISWSAVLKFAPYLAVAAVMWWALDMVYTQGREFEIAKCESERSKADIEAMKSLEMLRKELNTEREKADRQVTKIIGAYANEIEKLHLDLVDANDRSLFIAAKAENCRAVRKASAINDKDTGQTSREIRFEVPKTLGREIRRDYYDAEKLELDRNTLIDLVKTKPECFEVVE